MGRGLTQKARKLRAARRRIRHGLTQFYTDFFNAKDAKDAKGASDKKSIWVLNLGFLR